MTAIGWKWSRSQATRSCPAGSSPTSLLIPIATRPATGVLGSNSTWTGLSAA